MLSMGRSDGCTGAAKSAGRASPEQFGRNKVVEVSPSNRAAKKIRCFAPALSYGRLGLAAIRRRPSPNKGGTLDYPAADIQDVEHNDK
jgi:hypothetical protein